MTSNIRDIQMCDFKPDQTKKLKVFMNLFAYKWMHRNRAEQGACDLPIGVCMQQLQLRGWVAPV